jgi:hypothetical protein
VRRSPLARVNLGLDLLAVDAYSLRRVDSELDPVLDSVAVNLNDLHGDITVDHDALADLP